MTKKFFRIIALLVITVLLATACSSGNTTVKQKTPLRVGWSLWPGYYPMAIAVEKGLFKKYGVDVEPVFYNVYGEQAPDLASGMIDGALIIFSDVLFDSISNQTNIVMVVDNSTGADQLVAASSIKNPQDLRGKRIGVQPSAVGGTLLVRAMLEKNGIPLSSVTFVEVSPENVPSAIPGTIDVGYTYEPFVSQARANGDTILFTSADTPGLIVDVLAFRRDITQNRPEDVKAFIQAWLEAVQYWKDNPQEGNAIIARATNQNISDISAEGLTLFGLAENQKAFTEGNDITSLYFTTQTDLKFLVENGFITKPIDANVLLNTSFLK